MTGIEGTALAIGGQILKALAAPAATALARKATFRWKVARRVRRRVDFPCSWKTYRKWLATISAEELGSPVEMIQAPLAKRLDAMLSETSNDWLAAEDHLSRALLLVELTFPAIAAALGDSDRAALSESWAQQRSVTVRQHLLQLDGPGAALSSSDFARVLEQRSNARRAVRLQAFGVREDVLASYLDRIEFPDVPEGGVIVLVGDFGSGKSESAEAWHRHAIEEFSTCSHAPFPVWVNAREQFGPALEDAIDRQVGLVWRHGRGASIAVDGLDETDPAIAQALLEAARVLTKTATNIRVLVTARPGILSPTPVEERTVELLPEERALKLVELAGGKSPHVWHWTSDMRATVTRPFFALAAGVMLGHGETPGGEADLIRGLVQNALSDGTERPAVTSIHTRSILQKLAVSLTRDRVDGLSFGDQQVARSSRLAADGPNGSVRFSLPIFQHWFAAQALLSGDVPASDVVVDVLSFDRWRWAAVVAALSATSADAVDELLSTWVSGNPGAAAWIIKEAFSGHRKWRTTEDEVLDPKTSGTRFLKALRTWGVALGPMANGVLPAQVLDGPVELGVSVSGQHIKVALSASRPPADKVLEVPPGVSPFAPDRIPNWRPWFSGAAPQGIAWPWRLMRHTIADRTRAKLSNDPHLGAPEGIWAAERRFDLARRLAGRGSHFHSALSADEVKAQAVRTFSRLGGDRGARFSINGSATYSGAELEDLVTWIDVNAPTHMLWDLPEPDLPHRLPGPGWDLYSPNRLMEFEVEVYGHACRAYDEALSYSFASLGWSMPSYALAPFGVLLEVQFDGATRLGGISGLTAMRVPMELMGVFVAQDTQPIWSTCGRAVIKRSAEDAPDWDRLHATMESVHAWLTKQNREPTGGLGWSNTGTDDMTKVRPASSLAADWLWDDLQSLGLGEGTSPQLT